MGKHNIFEHLNDYYSHATIQSEPIAGYQMFHRNALMLREPALIKQILVQDFNKFSNRYSSSNINHDVMGAANLFMLRNPMWRTLRKRISPLFTLFRLKKLFPLVNEIGDRLNAHLSDQQLNGHILEYKELQSSFTMDSIASYAFGVYANCLKNPNSEFHKVGRSFFSFSIGRFLEFASFFVIPELATIFKLKLIPTKMANFFRCTINDIMNEREKSLGTPRNDLIEALIELKNEDANHASAKNDNKNEIVFQGDILVAQAAIFFMAGYETSSLLSSFALFELAWNQDMQMRLRNEIKNTLHECNNKLTLDDVMRMEYLQMIVLEILRLHPASPYLDRLCEEDNYSLEPYHTFKIPKGMPIIIPIYAIHRDPNLFPDPLKFNPERFSPENRNKIIPYSFLPFGGGPRICVGEQLGLIQSKIGIINVLRNHIVKPSASLTPKQITLSKKSFSALSDCGIHLETYFQAL